VKNCFIPMIEVKVQEVIYY